MGGTFNPIHYGHLRIAEQAAEALDLSAVWFIPNRVPPHRASPTVTAQHRLNMVRLAVADNPRFAVEPIEIEDESHRFSYTFDTVAALKARHPQAQFTFIGGSDSLLRKWYRLPELIDMLEHFCAVYRPGMNRADFERIVTEKLGHIPPQIFWLETDGIDISSTKLRNLMERGQSLRYLMPQPVADYIAANGLYAELRAVTAPDAKSENNIAEEQK